jgi:hypothetical protein
MFINDLGYLVVGSRRYMKNGMKVEEISYVDKSGRLIVKKVYKKGGENKNE